ncbi:efflux RND transporter periplasmic adaptor subunit [Gaoshiqia sediminis]|uniref:Efflux RND transporter periplasmic adaptor subunit n=1 Tax=Gaoshiqia sediminis TaxID=2986998 RepID=A0AA41Y6T8_9BACT|nr:efflux RND transporter periplasmic adaptor subunit [Gaoshiqia sediminis]MCW0484484.1 efflux RND transporter periplasmic adaptor subunit [Gaoshiqia sediminis]
MSMDRVIEKKKGIKLKYIFGGVGVLVLVFLVYTIFFTEHQSVYRAEKDKLTVSTVEDGLFNDYITVIGQVEPITTIYLDAIEGGRVEERLIEEGAMVEKGDVILKLENKQLYQTILNSEAALAEKENYLRNTRIGFETELIQSRKNLLDNTYRLTRKKRTFEQYEKLFSEELISKEDHLQAKEDYEYEVKMLEINKLKSRNDSMIRVTSMKTLETDLQKMRQMLELVRERLDNLNVKAPVDGQLGMLDAEVGQSINQGQRIGMVHVLTNYKVNAKIDEHYIDRVRRDLKATFDRNATSYRLNVKKVYPEVREGQFKIDMVFEGEKPDNIRAGQTYHVKLELGQSEKAVLLPRGGFFQSTGGQWVFVLSENGTEATRRPVRIGKQNPQYYEVLEGLQPGEQVITSSYELFGNNDKIVFK